MARVQLALATVGACVLAALGALLVAGRGDDRGRTATAGAGTGWAGAERPPGMPPVRFAGRDAEGERIDLRALRGRPAIVTFVYARCEDTCPLVADQIRGALDLLGDEAVPVVAVSVDPDGDTPAAARRFLLDRSLTRRARFVVGPRAELRPLWRQFAIQSQEVVDGTAHDHTPSTVLLDGDGRQRVGFLADQITPEGVAHDVRRLAAG